MRESGLFSVAEIDPVVRLAMELTLPSGENLVRAPYDHRLFCLRAGSCTLEVGGARLTPTVGDLLLIRSGTPYRFRPGGEGVRLIVVNFDFFGAREHTPREMIPIPPYSAYRREKLVEAVDFREGVLAEGYAHLEGDRAPRELLSLVSEAERGGLFSAEQMNAYMKTLLLTVFRRLLLPDAAEDARHREILAYLAEHYAEPLDNRTIARRFHYHPNYIGELIRAVTGMPLHRYLLHLRIRRASELLASSALPVSEIARQTGFPNAAYFTSYFRRTVGVTPTEMREKG